MVGWVYSQPVLLVILSRNHKKQLRPAEHQLALIRELLLLLLVQLSPKNEKNTSYCSSFCH